MILQDLIRNILLYNGVIDPYIQSVKGYVFSFLASSIRQNNNISSVLRAYNPEERAICLPSSITGTCTTSYTENVFSVNSQTFYGVHNEIQYRDSSIAIAMPVDENIVNSSKTHSRTDSSSLIYTHNQTGTYVESTTGFYTEKPNLFFSHETHEKREYLGEFSLPHEEIQLNIFKGRG